MSSGRDSKEVMSGISTSSTSRVVAKANTLEFDYRMRKGNPMKTMATGTLTALMQNEDT